MSKHHPLVNFLTDYSSEITHKKGTEILVSHTQFLNELRRYKDLNTNVVMEVPTDNGRKKLTDAELQKQKEELNKAMRYANAWSGIVKTWDYTISKAKDDKDIGPVHAFNMAYAAFSSDWVSNIFKYNVAAQIIKMTPDCIEAIDQEAQNAPEKDEAEAEATRKMKRVVRCLAKIHDSDVHPIVSAAAAMAAIKMVEGCCIEEKYSDRYPKLGHALKNEILSRNLPERETTIIGASAVIVESPFEEAETQKKKPMDRRSRAKLLSKGLMEMYNTMNGDMDSEEVVESAIIDRNSINPNVKVVEEKEDEAIRPVTSMVASLRAMAKCL